VPEIFEQRRALIATADEFLETVRTGKKRSPARNAAEALRARGAEARPQRSLLVRQRQEVQEVPRQGRVRSGRAHGPWCATSDPVPASAAAPEQCRRVPPLACAPHEQAAKPGEWFYGPTVEQGGEELSVIAVFPPGAALALDVAPSTADYIEDVFTRTIRGDQALERFAGGGCCRPHGETAPRALALPRARRGTRGRQL
jgi:hypothetical protein